MGQYFSNDPSIKEDKHYIKYFINNKELLFLSDNGVFSKNYVDFGSSLLIKTCLDLSLKGEGVDLGCGIGVIGLTLSLFNKDINFDCVDVNKKAIELSKYNYDKYNIKANIFYNDGLEGFKENSKDFIITNPPIRAGKSVIYKFYEDSYKVLKKDGILILVIQKKQGMESTKNKLTELFLNCTIINKDNRVDYKKVMPYKKLILKNYI